MNVLHQPLRSLQTREIVDAPPVTTLRAASRLLAEEYVSSLIVDDPRGTLGIVTERDLVQALADGVDPDEERVGSIMSEDLAMLSVDATVLEAVQLMRANEIRHLALFDGDELVAVISMRDLLEVVVGSVLATVPSEAA